MEEDDADAAPVRRRLHPMVKLAIGLPVGGATIWLVVSTAGGVGDALDAVGRMRGGFVALAMPTVAA